MPRPGTILVALASVVCLAAAGASPNAGTLVTYTLEETLSSTTPNGERATALAARVKVAGEKARVELSATSFPRARGGVLLFEGGGAVLVDAPRREAARLEGSVEELFAAPEGEAEPGAGVRVREKTVKVERDGAGAPFQGRPTARWRVLVNAYVNVTTPGRVATIHDVTKGTVETIEMPDAASPMDDLLRLFRARGEVRAALAEELGSVHGFAVRVRLESERELSAEAIGQTAPHQALDRPMKTTARAERTVRDLTTRPLAAQDAALFALPDDVRMLALDRLRNGDAPPR